MALLRQQRIYPEHFDRQSVNEIFYDIAGVYQN